MSDAPIDMHFPETFHRLKRTILLLSSALIALSFSVPAKEQSIHLTVVDVSISSLVLKAFLSVAAGYYLWGFWLEMRTTQRLNSTTMRSKGARDYESAMTELAAEISKFSSAIDEQRKEVNQATENFQGSRIDFDESSGKTMAITIKEELTRRSDAAETLATPELFLQVMNFPGEAYQVIQRHISEQHRFELAAEQLRSTLKACLDKVESTVGYLNGVLNQTHRDMTTLSPRIAEERRMGFWLWDVGGAFSLYAVSLLICWVPFVFELLLIEHASVTVPQ